MFFLSSGFEKRRRIDAKEKHSRLDKVLDTVEKLGEQGAPSSYYILNFDRYCRSTVPYFFYLLGQHVTFDAINAETGSTRAYYTHVKVC